MQALIAAVVLMMSAASHSWFRPAATPPIPARIAMPIDPGGVRLLDGPFKAAQDRTAAYLLGLDPDRLLARFRKQAGLSARAEGYGGWEGETISGHTLGHYLSACAKMFAATGDRRFCERTAAIIRELAECQAAHGDGYVGAIPGGREALEEVSRGEIRSKGFDLNGIWVPWYTLHKQMAGLRDCHLLCRNAQALEVLRGLGDYALRVTDRLSADQLGTMLRCEHGGMNEVATDLFELTKDRRYLLLARRFNDRQVIDPFADHRDVLPGLHSNTQIPKFIGAARQAEIASADERADEPRLAEAARFFWQTMTENHTYVTGGNSLNEYLGPPRVLGARLNGNTTETCNTYNMLKLTRILHSWDPRASFMDYYERALYNHILASQDPGSAAVCYFVPLRTGSRKAFQSLDGDFTCCVGTGMENHASYADAIYSRTGSALLVNLFIPSTVDCSALDVSVRQETGFPDSAETALIFAAAPARELALRIRRPWWLEGDPVLTVNGEPAEARLDLHGYLEIRRQWRAGDRVTLSLPAPIMAEATPDEPSTVALMAGPIVLAGVLGDQILDPSGHPYIVTDDPQARDWIDRIDGPRITFRSRGSIVPQDVTLVPLFRIADECYAVYWTRLTRGQWSQHQERLRELDQQRQELESRTADFVQPGQMQSERDHGFEGDRTNTGEFRGVHWRDAYRGSWFSFRLKVPPDAPAELVCTYWGGDFGDREFDILVDGVKVATRVLENNRPGEFYDESYRIPAALTRGKQHVTVKFQAHPQKTAGGVFGLRIVRTAGDEGGGADK